MQNPVSSMLDKAESLILPVSSIVTFFGDDIKTLGTSGVKGVIGKEIGYITSWHVPTIEGLMNGIETGPLGSGAMVGFAGWAIEAAGKLLGAETITRIGKDFGNVGKGVVIAGLADQFIRPSKYNPGAGHGAGAEVSPGRVGAGHGLGDPIMRNPFYQEQTGKQANSAPLLPR